MLKTLEFRRKVFHVLFGITLILLLQQNILNATSLFIVLWIGMLLIASLKRNFKVPLVYRILECFERKKHMRDFPGRGSFFFVLGSWLTLVSFPLEIAIAAIAILSFGDAVTNLIGRNFGRIPILFKPKKSIEGTVAGIAAGFVGAMCFTTLHPLALLVASCLGMLAEIPHLYFGRFPLDDNLTIPMVAGGILHVIYLV